MLTDVTCCTMLPKSIRATEALKAFQSPRIKTSSVSNYIPYFERKTNLISEHNDIKKTRATDCGPNLRREVRLVVHQMSFQAGLTTASRPFPDIKIIYQHAIPNVPGKSIVAMSVTFLPNASTPPHTHAGAFGAFYTSPTSSLIPPPSSLAYAHTRKKDLSAFPKLEKILCFEKFTYVPPKSR